MAWATTVVKLPRDLETSGWLAEDLAKFPAEFLLFSPHVGRVVIEDRPSGGYREVSVSPDDFGYVLNEDGQLHAWSVHRVDHVPTKEARYDAGEIAGRETVPVIWAVPREAARGRGAFWAFFPTEMGTTLTGIINAPWKTNEDRQNLLRGAFNEELLDVVADLVVATLPQLATPDDPGKLFDILPARGREAPSWADERLSIRIYERALNSPSVPDQSGQLVLPAAIYMPPPDLPEEALRAWASYANRPSDWTHMSVETRERRPRVERLVDGPQVATHSEWLEALVADRSPTASIAALGALAASLAVLRPKDAADAKRSRIVLTADGLVVPPDPTAVFTSTVPTESEFARFLHPEIEADPATVAILADLGIGQVDRSAEYRLYLERIDRAHSDWEGFWAETAKLSASRAIELISVRSDLPSMIRFPYSLRDVRCANRGTASRDHRP